MSHGRSAGRRPGLRSPDGVGALFDAHAAHIFRWLARETQTSATAADLTAETFARALTAGSAFRGSSPESEIAWLFSVARNLLLQHRRSERVELRASRRLGISLAIDEGLFEEVDSRIEAVSSREALEGALAGLSPGQQEIVRRVVLLEESPSEAARALGLEPAAVRMRLSRALRAMRTYLQQSGAA